MHNLLEVRSLSAGYGAIQVLRNVNLEVKQGEIVTMIGANGAGKSTLLKTISGLLSVRSGDIVYNGASIRRWSCHQMVQSGLIHVPEGREILKKMTVQENLLVGGAHRPKAEVLADLEKMYAQFPILKEKSREFAGTLSGGQQQMLAIARGLMAKPTLLMLDEPSLGLAPLLIKEIFQIILSLKQSGITVLLIEQNARQALKIADRAYVMEKGEITLSGTGHELLHVPEVVHAYLGG